MFTNKSLSTLFTLFFVTTPAFADNFGRDSKGVPFRMDSAGNQLSDYIAELEVTNKELRSQIFTLEGRARNLPQQTLPPAIGSAQMACPQLANQGEIQRLKEQYENQVRISQDQLNKNFGEIALLREERKSLEANLNNAFSDIESLRKGNGDNENKSASALENLQNQLSKCNTTQNQAFNETLKDVEGKSATLKMERDNLSEQNNELNQQLSAVNMQLAEALNLKDQNAKIAQIPVPETKRASMTSETPNRTVAVQAPLKVQLSNINSLVSERKNLLDSVKNRSRGVMISLQTLASDNGTSLDTFRVMANNNDQIDEVVSGLSQIERKLNEDIQTLRRLNKI